MASARKITEELLAWILCNEAKASEFEQTLVKLLSTTLRSRVKSLKSQREKMWTSYHSLRTSKNFRTLWESLFKQLGVNISPILCQYVSHHIFKLLITKHFTIDPTSSKSDDPKPLTLEETFGLRYAAGYIPRSLRKKLTKSKHPLKNDLLLCLFDLLDEGDDNDHESKRWVESINRGGLTRVNNGAYDVFVAMECEIRGHLSGFQLPNHQELIEAIVKNEDVQFFWSIVSSDWEHSSATALLEMVVREWMKIRGFSLASAWIEKYKVAQKQTFQKSKGVRKQLISSQKKAERKSVSGSLETSQEPEAGIELDTISDIDDFSDYA